MSLMSGISVGIERIRYPSRRAMRGFMSRQSLFKGDGDCPLLCKSSCMISPAADSTAQKGTGLDKSPIRIDRDALANNYIYVLLRQDLIVLPCAIENHISVTHEKIM